MKIILALVNFVYVDNRFCFTRYLIVLANLCMLFIAVLVALSVINNAF